MKNEVILCTSVEQGARIIEYFRTRGFNTGSFICNCVGDYYGVIDGKFGMSLIMNTQGEWSPITKNNTKHNEMILRKIEKLKNN